VLFLMNHDCGQDRFPEDDIFDDEQPEGMSDVVPALMHGYATYHNFQLVGNGEVTNDNCGKFKGLRGCLRVKNHDVTAPDGKNYKGKYYIKKVRFSCHTPSCPECYQYGWAVREAGNIEYRLMALSKKFGEVEHIMISLPDRDYGLSLECMRKKAVKILYNCGIIGGEMTFHGFRYNLKEQWYWSPHFHVLGFVIGGYSRCRHCTGGDCYACDGILGKIYKSYHDGIGKGYIVRVMAKRKKSYYGDKPNIFGTAWYQLDHSTIDTTKERFHVVTWFGVCSYRKFKLTRLRRKRLCPICMEELERVRFNGNHLVMNEDLSGSCRHFYPDAYDEYGRPSYVRCEVVVRHG